MNTTINQSSKNNAKGSQLNELAAALINTYEHGLRVKSEVVYGYASASGKSLIATNGKRYSLNSSRVEDFFLSNNVSTLLYAIKNRLNQHLYVTDFGNPNRAVFVKWLNEKKVQYEE